MTETEPEPGTRRSFPAFDRDRETKKPDGSFTRFQRLVNVERRMANNADGESQRNGRGMAERSRQNRGKYI